DPETLRKITESMRPTFDPETLRKITEGMRPKFDPDDDLPKPTDTEGSHSGDEDSGDQDSGESDSDDGR
ncbi:hypothetical protein, partial [Mycolicibacterium fortuitum]|nr:hypothetical protein [Mycolicibacterium fortuitum]